MKKLFIIVLLLVCSYAAVAHAEGAPEKRKEIEKMLRLTGTDKLVTQVVNQMIDSFKQQMPASDEFWRKFQQKFDVHQLIEQIIPVYDKYYTIEDLKAINAFYETPAGQKVITTVPQITRECMEIGQRWGKAAAKEAEAEIEKEKK